MRLTAAEMLARGAESQHYTWGDRDYLLYALALGLGDDPLHESALRFVYERELKGMPTYPTVVAWIAEPTFASLGAAPRLALHSGQKIEVHRVLTEATSVTVTGRVVSVDDKGPERGAVIVTRQEVVRAKDAQRIATLTTSCFARDCGGCGSGGEPRELHTKFPPGPRIIRRIMSFIGMRLFSTA